ncbi:MAG: HAMP domain-containing protein [Bacteroidetes bacterium]|nr:MAG: HAMP domain-containing protein [Bacteroidota bacterium]
MSRWRIKNINTKLRLYFLILIAISVSIGIVFFVYIANIKNYHFLRTQVDELLVLIPKLIKEEQNFINIEWQTSAFMAGSETQNLINRQKNIEKIKAKLESINKNKLINSLNISYSLEKVQENIKEHSKTFNQIKAKLKQRGFKNYGFEARMREAAHRLQEIKNLDMISLLTLRRNEKDFFLRKDWIYADSLKAESSRLVGASRKSGKFNIQELEKIILSMRKYLREFDKITRIESEIGFNEKQGLKAQLLFTSSEIEKEFTKIDELIIQNTKSLDDTSTLLVWFLFIFLIVVAVLFAVAVAYRFARPIVLLNKITQSVSKELVNQEVLLDKIISNDEIGSLAKNFKTMLSQLKNSLEQANDKNKQLEEFSQSEARRAWFNEGLAILNEVLRNHQQDLETQLNDFICELVKYTKSQQGGIFTINQEELENTYLELKACYAYSKQRLKSKQIELGEGLIGTTWKNNQTTHITEIPENYAHINSGLGTSAPKSILIVPVKAEDIVVGVLELLSFQKYQSYEIDLVETIASRLGTSIIILQNNWRTRQLLAASEEATQMKQEIEASLRSELEEKESWIKQFEEKLNIISNESQIYYTVLGKVFSGFIITNQDYQIRQVHNSIAKRLGFKRNELVGKPLELLLETDFTQIIDWKDKQLMWDNRLAHAGKLRQQNGEWLHIDIISGKLEMETETVFVFVFNEMKETDYLVQPNDLFWKFAS